MRHAVVTAVIGAALVSLLMLETGAAPASLGEPDQILEAARTRGAKVVVKELWESGVWQKKLFPGVSAADPRWLQVAKALRPATDAGASSELDQALVTALLKEPYLVLPILREAWKPKPGELCVFDYDSELPGGVPDYLRRLEQALAKQAPEESAKLRSECLSGVKESRRRLQQAPK